MAPRSEDPFPLLASSRQTARETHRDLRITSLNARQIFLSSRDFIHSCLGDYHNLRIKYFRQNLNYWIIKPEN